MEDNVKKALSNFVDSPEEMTEKIEIDNTIKRNVILDERSGLVERLDKIYVTKDGRQLLREQY